jgi:hypothetical protein
MFYKIGEHHAEEEYQDKEKFPYVNELQIYTWADATLRELGGKTSLETSVV